MQLKTKMKILLSYLSDIDSEYMPVFSPPYKKQDVKYVEWLCSYTTDVTQLYETYQTRKRKRR
jgi:hypothetical protein